MLARAREHHARKHVNELVARCKALGELVVDISLSDREAMLMNVLNPGLKFGVPGNVII